MSRCTVISDSRADCLKEPGIVILSGAEIHAEIDKVPAAKASDDPANTTLFKGVGIATEDLFAANLVYEKAVE